MTQNVAANTMSAENEQLVRYIRDMGRELTKLANDASLDFLAYLLTLVVLEAEKLSASDEAAGSEDSSLQY